MLHIPLKITLCVFQIFKACFFKSYMYFMLLIEVSRGHRQTGSRLFTRASGKKIELITVLPWPHWEMVSVAFERD